MADLYVGSTSGQAGTLTLSGAGTAMTTSRAVNIGYSGVGELAIESGASAYWKTAGYPAFVGRNAVGTLSITGTGSSLTSEITVNVGYSGGTGSMRIDAGGKGIFGTLSLGSYDGTGAATVSGTGSSLTLTNASYIGLAGTGSLLIDSGARVSFGNTLQIGTGSGLGVVTLSGAGSALTVANRVFIGCYNGTGSLLISGAAQASFGALMIGDDYDHSPTGALTLSGSTLTIGGGFILGTGSFWMDSTSRMTIGGNLNVTNAGATFGFEIDASNPPAENDPLISLNSLSLSADALYVISLQNVPEQFEGTILLLEVSQEVSDAVKSIVWDILGIDPSELDARTEWIGNSLYLHVGAIPEPAVAAGLLGLLALAAVARRRK